MAMVILQLLCLILLCACSDYTEATGGPDLKVAADCL